MDIQSLAISRQDRIARKFIQLIQALRPSLICDIGSLNAVDAQEFRSVAPWARIIAYEANPYNFDMTVRASRPWEQRIEFLHMAVAGHDGVAEFNVVKYDRSSGEYDWRGGASSLKPMLGQETERVLVACKRLDTHLSEMGVLDSGKALWVDVEGAADIVLSGAGRSLESTLFLKIELEQSRKWEGQALDIDVLPVVEAAGLAVIDTSKTEGVEQYDVLAVRRDLLDLFGRSGPLLTNAD